MTASGTIRGTKSSAATTTRVLACWGCLIALSGFVYDGPGGRLGFAPRWQAENFRAFFTAAEGWGTIEQVRQGQSQTNRIVVKHGEVRLLEFFSELPAGTQSPRVRVELEGQSPSAKLRHARRRTELIFAQPIVVRAGQTLSVTFSW